MDDDEYYNQLTTQAKVRSLNDVASDVRKHLSGAVENIIKAGQALQDGRDMHLSDNDFHDWCMQEFPDLKRHTRHNIMLVGKRFGGVEFIQHQLPITVLYELAAPSVPDELVEDIMSSDKPMKVKEVQQAKAGYKEVQENPDYGDILEDVKEKRKTPVEAAKEAWDRSEEKRREMENNPNVFDLNAHVKSTEHCTVDVSATNLVVAMEQLISKFDRRDVMMYLYSAIHDDVINIKIPALHEMSDILIELCEQLPLEGTNKQNLS
jgi:cell fate (sporulation/competence/biofilm development) regulator YlbF (YheA/YmcA/DUF963 family)